MTNIGCTTYDPDIKLESTVQQVSFTPIQQRKFKFPEYFRYMQEIDNKHSYI